MKKEIILIGSGGHAESCIDVINLQNEYTIAGLVIENIENSKKISQKFNLPILGNDKDLNKLQNNYAYAFISIGQIKNYKIRNDLFKKLINKNFTIPTIISPRSYVSKKSSLGKGVIVMHDALVNSNSVIENNCIINSKALLEHGVKIGNNTHISTAAVINGNTKIGKNCFIGSGAIINNDIIIGDNVIVASGSIIKNHIESNKIIKNEK